MRSIFPSSALLVRLGLEHRRGRLRLALIKGAGKLIHANIINAGVDVRVATSLGSLIGRR